MGNYHSTNKEKRNGTIPQHEPKMKRQDGIAVDVNISPPTIKWSKKQNKKRLERSKRIDYLELQNDVVKERPVVVPSELEQTRALGIKDVPLGGANGSTSHQPQKMTLLQHAEFPKIGPRHSENGIFSEESEKKNIGSQELLNKNDKLRACEKKAIHLIRVFPRLPEKPGDDFDIKKSDQIIQDKNIICENNIVEKSELDEHVESSVSCGTVAIGGRFVTVNDDDGKGLELAKFKYDLERERLRSDKIRPVSLPIATSQKDKSRCSMSKTLERPDIKLKEQRDVKRTIFFDDEIKHFGDINGGVRRHSKESWICTLRSQKSSTINKALQGLKVTPLDSKLYLPDSLELGISKKRELYKVNEMVELLSKPGALINLVGCHGSGKSEILSVLGLQFVKNKEIACLTVDCHGCNDERSVLQCLFRTLNLNLNPIPDDWLGDDNQCYVRYKELLKWLINYISFHGQIQLIVLMVDGLSIDSSLGRSCVEEFFIPLLERCISCLSILLSSSSNYLDVSEENLALNSQMIKISNSLPTIDLLDVNDIKVSIDGNKEIVDDGHNAQLTHIRAFKLQSSPYFPGNTSGGSLLNDSSIVSENNGVLEEIALKYRLTLLSCKVLINAAEVKPGSLHHLIQKAESCTHPSLIVLENEFVTRQEKLKSSTRDRMAVDTDGNNKQFQVEIMNASIILAALETMEDEEQTLASLMWLMSDFRLGFDLESVLCVMSTRKFLENDLDWRMNLSAKLETMSCGTLKESHEERSKVLNAITRLVKLGFLQIVKSPVTFSSPLSSRRGSLIDPIAKPSRFLDQKLNSFMTDGFEVSPDKLFPRYRIPNSIRPVARHLRPEFFGRPNLVLDHLMAKKMLACYQAFYSNESFSSVLSELDMIYSDFIRCLERNVVVEQDSDIIKSPTEFKACQPMMHACHHLTTLPGAIFLAQTLPLSTYMKIFVGISNMMKQRDGTKDSTTKDSSSLEYRALMCIILRHKMSASQSKTFANDPLISGVNSMKTKVDKNRLDARSSAASASPTAGLSCGEVDDPTNLFNSINGISGSSQLHETSVTDMISRIKFLLFQVNKADRAFFYYIMGIHLWPGDQDQALTLMKKSLDLFKESNPDQGGEILPNFGQVCIQIVSETYSWMLLSTHRTQAARHMYNLVDSSPSSSSSTSLVSPPTISQNFFPTASSTSSSYYSLHSHHGLSPSSCTSRNEEVGNGCITDKRVDICSIGDCANVSMKGNGGNYGQPPLKGPSLTNDIGNSIKGKNDFEQALGNNESLTILTHCRNTLKSMSDFNSHNSKSVISRNDTLILDKHPLKLRGLECRRKIWSELGLLARARDTAKSFVELSQQWWGPDHPSTSGALMGQCLVAEKLGRNNEAIEACIQALLSRLKFFGDKHHSSVESCMVLSRLLLKCSMYEESLELANRALNMTTFLLPQREDHVLEVEKIIATAEKKLKSEKPKREATASILKSVTFHPKDILIGKNEEGDMEKDKEKKAQDVMICSSAICKFDPELAQTFHRCFQVSSVA